MTSPSVNNVQLFVNAMYPCGPGPDAATAYIRSELKLHPDAPLKREHYDEFYRGFIVPNHRETWESFHGPLQAAPTSGIFSDFFYGKDEDETEPEAVEEKKKPVEETPPPPKVAIDDGPVTSPPAPPRPVTTEESIRRTQQRVALQSGLPPAWARVPPAPRQQLQLVQPIYDPRLYDLSVVNPKLLPTPFLLEQERVTELMTLPELQFPSGPQCPCTSPIPTNMVRWQISPAPYDDGKYPEVGEWLDHSLTYAKRERHLPNGGLTHMMSSVTLTAAKSGAHSVRAERHKEAAKNFDKLRRERRTVY
jgi:hypothetical protein